MTDKISASMGGIRFLDFPQEIRDLIYNHMFCHNCIPMFISLNPVKKLRKDAHQDLAILQSSKQVNQEATMVLHRKGWFQFPLYLTCDLPYLRKYTESNVLMLENLSHIEIHLDLYKQWLEGRISRYWTKLIKNIGESNNSRRQVCHVIIKCGKFARWPSLAIEYQWFQALKSLVGFKEVVVRLECPEWPFGERRGFGVSVITTAVMLDTFVIDTIGLLGGTLGPGVASIAPKEFLRPTSRCVRFYPQKYASSGKLQSSGTLEKV